MDITESQDGWGWKVALEVIWSNFPLKAGSPRAGWSGAPPVGFLISPMMEASQLWWATSFTLLTVKNFCLNRNSYSSVHPHCSLSCPWASLRRVWLHHHWSELSLGCWKLVQHLLLASSIHLNWTRDHSKATVTTSANKHLTQVWDFHWLHKLDLSL